MSHLTKRFGRVTAVEDVSFEVGSGEVVGILGPNGAGKSTTMRILSCFLPPTGGTVTVDGFDVVRRSLEVRRRIGYLPENVPLYPEMRVEEYLVYRAGLKGVYGRAGRRRVYDALTTCGLEDVRRRIVGQLSKGYRQRVGLADTLLSEPTCLILDEPSLGLDPSQRRDIRELIRRLASDRTILLSSHLLAEVELLCPRVLIFHRGRIVRSDSPARLVEMAQTDVRISLEVSGPREDVEETLRGLPGATAVEWRGEDGNWQRMAVHCAKGGDLRSAAVKALAAKNWEIREVRTETANLEEVFVRLIEEAAAR